MNVLHIVSNISLRNGIMSVLMNYYRYVDRKEANFCFLFFDERPETYGKEIEELGGVLYKFTRKNFMSEWRHFCKEHYGEFDVLHNHELYLAHFFKKSKKKLGNKILISHAHATRFSDSKIKELRNKILALPSKNADYLLACSKDAGKSLFNKNFEQNGYILKNAIDISRYMFNESAREQIRNKYNISNKFVVGHVGNFTPPKNHFFLLQVFNEIIKLKSNSILLLVGDGYLREEIKKEASNYGFEDKVIFVGVTNSVTDYLCAMDIYVFPSLFEGLGIALVEAQTNGLPCVYSDVIPQEADILNENNIRLSLDVSPKEWADEILAIERERYLVKNEIEEAGYDISKEALKLIQFYRDGLEGIESVSLRRG